MRGIITSTLNRNCGVGQYTEKLAQHLQPKLDSLKVFRKDDPDDELFFTYPYRSFRSLQHHVAPFFLSKAIKKLDADIWHADYLGAYYGMELTGIKKPKVVTVHDAIPFHYPGSKLDFRVYKYQLKKAIRNAKYLIVVSEAARQDLIQQTGIDPQKVVAIPNGLPLEELSTHPKENERFTIRYIGGLGAPHKNVKLLLQAAKILEDKKLDFALELGGYAPDKFFLKDLANELSLKSVKFTGFVLDEEKASFLGSADLFAYPSLIEGFGFPPMEAMGCGTAAITTNIPVFEELLGDSVLMVDPTPEAFAAGIEKLMKEQNLRKEYAAKGLEHVKHYTWDKAAYKTMEVFQKAMG
ncbi:glycosyltransferase family 4 protein [Ekhidna sp.]